MKDEFLSIFSMSKSIMKIIKSYYFDIGRISYERRRFKYV